MRKLLALLASFAALLPLPGAAQTPLSGHYGEHLALARSSDAEGPLLTGLYDRRVGTGHCRFHLYGRPLATGWRLLLSTASDGDLLLGRLQVDGKRVRLELGRAPRGCEAIYRELTHRPQFDLSEPRSWLEIRRIATVRAQLRERPDAQSQSSATVLAGAAVAILATQGRYVDASPLPADLDTRGWLAEADLAPLDFGPAGEQLWRRPLPGLSAPATVAERARWRAWLDWSDACESRHTAQREDDDGGLHLISFGPRGSLLRIGCGYLAQHEMYIYAWLPPGRLELSRLLLLPGFDPDRGEERVSSEHSELHGLDEIDRLRGELRIYSKYRDAGDCGQWLLLVPGEDGLVLREWRERSCDEPLPAGSEVPAPERWPLKLPN